jgi:hypothetical protein
MSDIKRMKQLLDEIKKLHPQAWAVNCHVFMSAGSDRVSFRVTLLYNNVKGNYPEYKFESVKELQDWVDHLKSKPREILFRRFSLDS